MSYAYHAVSSYFNRDNVALPGFVTYFRNASLDERSHAQKLMDFQVEHAANMCSASACMLLQ